MIEKQAKEFEDGVDLAFHVFGDSAFRKHKRGKIIGKFNRAIFDVIMFHFCEPDLQDLIRDNAGAIQSAFVELFHKNEFNESIERTTKSLFAVVTRLATWTEVLQPILRVDLQKPILVDNRIIIEG